MKRLHDEIMNILVPDGIEDQPPGDRIIYKTGHRDARHSAAELANKYDDNHERLIELLDKALGCMLVGIDNFSIEDREVYEDGCTLLAALEAEKGGEL